MPDESRVFDVSKPNKTSPPATSRPVIVGHHPTMSDPMVREDHDLGTEASSPTKIPVSDDSHDESPTIEDAINAHQAEAEDPETQGSPAVFSDPADAVGPPEVMDRHPESVVHSESVASGPFTEIEPKPKHPEPEPKLPEPAKHSEPDVEGLHFPPKKRRRSPAKLAALIILVLIIAFYLLVDSGAVNAGFKMPFHIFKQKTQTASAPPTAAKPQTPAGPTVPTGFKEYKLADTQLTFAAPTAWGDPTSTTEQGYSKRGGTSQPDGTYAYLVNFAANKDIQIAVTSSKYLPPARTPNYYDFLQWCTGTNDGLIYESVLNFSTANKIDTPTTITCNQGPVTGASKLDQTTIVQTQAKDLAGKVIGDIYTKNLNDPTLVVFRVKDAASTSGTDIKQLLGTVQTGASQNSSSSTP